IRLLQLLPGTGEEDVQCQIFQYTLKPERGHGIYEALSYVWGDPNHPRRISLKNHDDFTYHYLDVTTNLYAALLRLRDADLPRTMWIDAISINQEDLHERARQVSMMSTIYSLASQVVVWLGEESDDSTVAFETIWRGFDDDRKGFEAESLDSRGNSSNSDKDLSLRKLLTRPYFRRVWVLQEVAAARSLSVVCGSSELHGSIFVGGLNALGRTTSIDGRDSYIESSVVSILRLMSWSATPLRCPILSPTCHDYEAISSLDIGLLAELVEMFHTQEASDRRDKIFALLGMSSDQHKHGLQPDYKISWSLMFQRLIHNTLGPHHVATTWDDKEQAVITGWCCPLGTVTSVDKENIAVGASRFAGPSEVSWSTKLKSHKYCKQVKEGDILCMMEGAQHPSLIRLCNTHFDVVVIAL
ncbi:HET-domain-containing protein, partial [Dothidotthia symphoricarpi CBS 119687]